MKTIIVRTEGNNADLNNFMQKLEKYADKQIQGAVVCSRFLAPDNFNTICGEMKDATSLNDFDLFIVGVTHQYMDITALQSINKAHTLTCTVSEYDSAKNYVIML